jgi:hypothetical protein
MLTDEQIWTTGSTLTLSERGVREFARAIEKLVREATLEEAAKVCEDESAYDDVDTKSAISCANAIRALKGEPT